MILHQFYLGCLAHASYLIGDEASGEAAIVDPQRDVEQYLEAAAQRGLRIAHVLLTHFHADFVAGHLELQKQTGALIYLGRRAGADYDHTALADGDVVSLGRVQLRILETPGHTPEGISIVVHDGTAPAHAVLTGDTLFIGDVGRPDLMTSVGVSQEELAGMLYDSLHDKLLQLPDETLVYPAHGAGSMCGKSLSTDTVSTIGKQRQFNYALQPMTKAEFVRQVTADLPRAPRYFAHDAKMNQQLRPTLDEVLGQSLTALPLEAVVRMLNSGAQLLDTREEDAFGSSHVRGAINIGLSGKFATWAGALLDLQQPVVLLCDPGRELEAATRLLRVGIDRIAGYLDCGMDALAARQDLCTTMARANVREAHDRLAQGDGTVVVDVRTKGEWATAHIDGSVNIPLLELSERLDELPKNRPLLLLCRTGYRSACAASMLERAGVEGGTNVVGGITAWQQEGLHAVS